MKKGKRPKKGQYGYRDYHKKVEMVKLLCGIAAIGVQLWARRFTGQEAMKNILTVMAILSALPVANVAAPLLAAFRYRTPGEEFYRRLSEMEQKVSVLYDLVITSKEQILPMDGIVVHPAGVYAYCSNPGISVDRAETFLNDLFRAHRLDPRVKVLTDENAFFKRAKALKPEREYEDDGSVAYGINLLKDISM